MCIYLKSVGLEAYKALMDNGPSRSDDLAEESGPNAASVYHNLQKLMSCGILAVAARTWTVAVITIPDVVGDKAGVKRNPKACLSAWNKEWMSL